MSLFEEFRDAWRQGVENFWRELNADPDDPAGRAVYRQVGRARTQLEELDGAMADARQRIGEEEEQVEACTRRERLARTIGDEETARIAADYRSRHQERAAVLRQKLAALEAERRLCLKDLKEMENALRDGRVAAPEGVVDDFDRHPRESEFRTLEDSDRDRSAEERLEELKRRMKK